MTYDGDKLGVGGVFELKAERGIVTGKLLEYDCADFDVVWERGGAIGND